MVHIRKWDPETSHAIRMDLGLLASFHARLNILEDILLGHSAATSGDRMQDNWEIMFANDEEDCRSLMVLDDESRGMVEEAFRKSRDDRERLRQRWKEYFSQVRSEKTKFLLFSMSNDIDALHLLCSRCLIIMLSKNKSRASRKRTRTANRLFSFHPFF